jgi:hypothetical protein
MRRFLANRPSPAMAVAFVALLAALSGTAIALPGTNTVDSGDIQNGAVKTKDIKNNDVRSGDVRNGTLTGGDVRNDSLTGGDINDGTLGQVPSANTANSANSANTANTANSANTIGGLVVRRVHTTVATDGATAVAFDVAGLKLTVACPGGLLDLAATTAVNDAVFASHANDGGSVDGIRDSDFDIGVTIDPIDTLFRGQVTINYARITGEVVAANLSVDDSNTFDSFDGCEVSGVLSATG